MLVTKLRVIEASVHEIVNSPLKRGRTVVLIEIGDELDGSTFHESSFDTVNRTPDDTARPSAMARND